MGESLVLHLYHECRSKHPGPDLVKGWGSGAHDSGRNREWHRAGGPYTVDQGKAPSIRSRKVKNIAGRVSPNAQSWVTTDRVYVGLVQHWCWGRVDANHA